MYCTCKQHHRSTTDGNALVITMDGKNASDSWSDRVLSDVILIRQATREKRGWKSGAGAAPSKKLMPAMMVHRHYSAIPRLSCMPHGWSPHPFRTWCTPYDHPASLFNPSTPPRRSEDWHHRAVAPGTQQSILMPSGDQCLSIARNRLRSYKHITS